MTARPTRRAVVLAAPAVLTAGPVPAESASPLRALYFEWRAIKLAYAQMPEDVTPEEDDRLFGLMCAAERKAAEAIPDTLEDLWIKIAFADDDGAMAGNIHQETLVAQAYEAAGLDRPRGRL